MPEPLKRKKKDGTSYERPALRLIACVLAAVCDP